MIFSSIEFLVFGLAFFIIYWNTGFVYRKYVILFANVVFYFFTSVKALFILFFICLFSYRAAFILEKYRDRNNYIYIYILSIAICVFPLMFYKCSDYIVMFIDGLTNSDINITEIAIPIGISFYTFEALSYLIDVKKKKIEPEKDLVYYVCYLSFFPTVLSGPIEKCNSVVSQLKEKKKFNYNIISYGLKLFAVGLYKKLVIADNINIYIDSAFNDVYSYKGFSLLIVIILYTIQIYADFSGYSDMAKGYAMMLGIDIKQNFDHPYLSVSIKEFWNKWHISLGLWLKEYIYLPLGGNKKGKYRTYLNILVVFIISGLWHGKTINCLVWGLIHGILQIVERFFNLEKHKKKNYSLLRNCILLIIISLTWVLFRCNSLSDTIYIINPSNILYGFNGKPLYWYVQKGFFDLGLNNRTIPLMFASIIIFIFYDVVSAKIDLIEKISKKSLVKRWFVYIAFCLLIIFMMPITRQTKFLYFNY